MNDKFTQIMQLLTDSGDFTEEQLRGISNKALQLRSFHTMRKMMNVRIGSKVVFSDKWGCRIQAVVRKVNRKTVICQEENDKLWKVSHSLLKVLQA